MTSTQCSIFERNMQPINHKVNAAVSSPYSTFHGGCTPVVLQMSCIVAIFNSPCHLGSHILSLRVGLVCAVCLCVETIAWLPMLGIFLHAHNTNFNACNCKRRLCKPHKRVKTETDRLRGVGWRGWWGGGEWGKNPFCNGESNLHKQPSRSDNQPSSYSPA